MTNELVFPEIEVPADFGNFENAGINEKDETVNDSKEKNIQQIPTFDSTNSSTVVEDDSTEEQPAEEESKPKEEPVKEAAIENEEESDDVGNQSIKLHIEALRELGYLYLPEDFEINEENLEEAYRLSEIQKNQLIAQEIINKMPEKLRDVVVYGLNGGTEIDQFLQVESEVGNLSYDLSSRDGQVKVMRDYLKSKGNDDYYVDAIIDRLEDTDKLESEAKARFTELSQEHERRKEQMLQEAVQQREEAERAQREFHNSVIQQLQQEKWNQSVKQELYSMIYEPTAKTGYSRFQELMNSIQANPAHLIQFARVLRDQYDPQKGFSFNEKEITQIKKGLADKFKTAMQPASVGKGTQPKDVGAAIDWDKVDIPYDPIS